MIGGDFAHEVFAVMGCKEYEHALATEQSWELKYLYW